MNFFSVVLQTCIFVHQRPISGGSLQRSIGVDNNYGKLMFICSEIVVFGVLVFEENL